jgi:NAD(P)-dependent dehydrogenase (short-subunit alcohol dehydrogenase family)
MRALEGKVAVITGATSGIGARTAERFVMEGARVVLAGRRRDRGEMLATALGNVASFVPTDVSIEADVKNMIDHTVRLFGRLDCLFNNAGTPSHRGDVADIDLADFDATIAVHVRGVLAGMKYAAPIMARQESGSIINTASINGVRAGFGGLDYSTAKAAVIHLTRCAAVELGERGIRVNSLSPGPVLTGIFGKGAGLDGNVADDEPDAMQSAFAEVLPTWQPLRGMATIDDIAQAALFLASDASRFVNGHDLVVDGGITAGRPAGVRRAERAIFVKAFEAFRSGRLDAPQPLDGKR